MEKLKEMEKEVWAKFNEYFPEGKTPQDPNTLLRSRALAILMMAKEMGVQGHADHIRKTEQQKERKR